MVFTAGPDGADHNRTVKQHNILENRIFFFLGCFSSGFYFYLSSTCRGEVCVITNGHFQRTMCAGVWHTLPLACYTRMSNSLCCKCVLAGGKEGVMLMVMMFVCVCEFICDPYCTTWGICTPIEPLAKHTCSPPTLCTHTHTQLQTHTFISAWSYITLIRRASPGTVADDISSGGPMLQACRKWLAEEQTGHDSSEESLDRDSCYPGLSSTGELTTTHLNSALFRLR